VPTTVRSVALPALSFELIHHKLRNGLRVVLAPEAPDTAELLKDGVNAALVPPGDLEALLTTLRRVTSDTALAERLSAGATEVARGLTWDSRAVRIRDFITARLAVTP